MQTGQLGHMRNGQQLHQRLNPGAYTVGDTRTGLQPGDMLSDPGPTMMTVEAADRHLEPNSPVSNIALTHATPTPAPLMDQDARFAAETAQRIGAGSGVESNLQRTIV